MTTHEPKVRSNNPLPPEGLAVRATLPQASNQGQPAGSLVPATPQPVLLYADRLPPLIGGMEQHAGALLAHLRGHPRFPLAGLITKDADGNDLEAHPVCAPPAILFFNSGRWIEELPDLRRRWPQALFVYRTGGNEILKAPLTGVHLPDHRARQAFWAATLTATIDLLITNSAFTEGRLREIGVGCPFARCVGGVDQDALSPIPRQPCPPTLFCAARFVPYKNHALLLHTTRLLLDQGHDLRLRLAGDGPLLAPTRALAARLGLDQAVTFLGALDHSPTCAEIARADLYVQLSGDVPTAVEGGSYLHCEGMGRSILEALSAGTFVIAGHSGALPEIVTPDRGRLVPLTSAEGIAAEIGPLLAAPPRPPPTPAWAWPHIFEHYERLWEEHLAHPRHH